MPRSNPYKKEHLKTDKNTIFKPVPRRHQTSLNKETDEKYSKAFLNIKLKKQKIPLHIKHTWNTPFEQIQKQDKKNWQNYCRNKNHHYEIFLSKSKKIITVHVMKLSKQEKTRKIIMCWEVL